MQRTVIDPSKIVISSTVYIAGTPGVKQNVRGDAVQRKDGTRSSLHHYASEDGVLAEWLTLRLAAEGYKVWCDKVKLLGGESYPLDVDLGIKDSTFRFISLLSKHSLRKPNPLKERTLAINIGRERKIDFVIPLNVDGLSPTQLDWMTNDLTFIPFHQSWADGLARLLKKLVQIQAPRQFQHGRESVAKWATTQENILQAEELLWSNLLPIVTIPEFLGRYSLDNGQLDQLKTQWPFYRVGEEVWAFGPPSGGTDVSEIQQVKWTEHEFLDQVKTVDVISSLLRITLFLHCLKKGMRLSRDGRDVYFGDKLLPENKLQFLRYDGKPIYVKSVGTRSFRLAHGETEKSVYHLLPQFKPFLGRFGGPCYQLNLGIIWTDSEGIEYPRGKSNRRRRKLTRNWWNYQWLSRITGLISWITDGQRETDILITKYGSVRIATSPIRVTCPMAINEDLGSRGESEDAEDELLEDLSEEETEADDDADDE